MNWDLHIANPARKALATFPAPERDGILAVIERVGAGPMGIGIQHLSGHGRDDYYLATRSYRLLMRIDWKERITFITHIAQRTPITYRKWGTRRAAGSPPRKGSMP